MKLWVTFLILLQWYNLAMIDLVFVLTLVYNSKFNLFIETSYGKYKERQMLSEYFKMHNNQNDKVWQESYFFSWISKRAI